MCSCTQELPCVVKDGVAFLFAELVARVSRKKPFAGDHALKGLRDDTGTDIALVTGSGDPADVDVAMSASVPVL